LLMYIDSPPRNLSSVNSFRAFPNLALRKYASDSFVYCITSSLEPEFISLVKVDITPSDEWSSYLMASNASLTDCFVMTGVSLAIAGRGDTVVAAAVDAIAAMAAGISRSKKPRRVVFAARNAGVDEAAMETPSPVSPPPPPPPIRDDARPKRVDGDRHRGRGATHTKPLDGVDVRKMRIADGSNNALRNSMAEITSV
jgi:hypothetical protein